MKINQDVNNRVGISYHTNQNMEYFAGVAKNEEDNFIFDEKETGFAGEYVDDQEFYEQWMSQNGVKQQSFMEKLEKQAGKDSAGKEDGLENNLSDEDITDYWQIISDRINELFVKIQNGETEPSYQIGSQSFTIKEWDELLKKFDTMEEAIRELQKEEQEKRKAEDEQDAITKSREADVNLLVTESVSCRFPSGNPEEDDTLYLIAYDSNGIYCIKAGEQSCEWEIKFTDASQYEKVRDFLNSLNSLENLDNLRFAAHENFWQDFLQDKIDIEDFKEFLAGTNNGVPDYSITIGDSMYIDKEKIKYAPYMNSFGAHLYSADEFQKLQEAIIAANAATLQKLTDSYTDIYRITHPEYHGERIFCEYPGGPLYTADEIAKQMLENLKNPHYC